MVAHNFIDLVGGRFGALHVVARADDDVARGSTRWSCLCDCGAKAVVAGLKLRQGHTKSCGCRRQLSGRASPRADRRPILDRLAEHSHCDLETGCLIWNGNRQVFGHGNIGLFGQRVLVHRASWEAQRGPIPDGLDCLHNCPGGDNPACWNVDHLWLGTQADNNADRDRKGRHVSLPGELHGCARLTDAQVSAMRSDTRGYAAIAAEHGISEAHVGDIMRGENWSHIPGAVSRKRGDNHCHAKITAETVRAIRSDPRSSRRAAADYGVSSSNICLIRSGKAWKHVT